MKEVKRNSWVTRENFKNVYENVYKRMVETGIAEKDEIETQYEGLPLEYRLALPYYLLFVDETGCNTNQLNDGKVGDEVFIMPKDCSDAEAPAGATTDLHYTALLSPPGQMPQFSMP
jgi:hypothetical protein